jgi:hypothetical protein
LSRAHKMANESENQRSWQRDAWPWPAMLLGTIALTAATARLAAMASAGFDAWHGPRGSSSVIFFHLVAEFLMATLPAVGAVAWWYGRHWGPQVMVLGLGASAYASLNAIGWALVNQVALAIPMALGLAVAVAVIVRMMAQPQATLGPRTWRRAVLIGSPFAVRTDVGLSVFRDLAELLMVLAGMAGARAWVRRAPYWPTLGMASLGLFLYASLNTTSQAIVVSKPWAALEAATLVGVLIVAREILLSPDAHGTRRIARRAPAMPARRTR